MASVGTDKQAGSDENVLGAVPKRARTDADVIDPLAQRRGSVLLIDGGLATHMESLGEDIDHELWSARCLVCNPTSIQKAHSDFYEAGAEVAITASYQAHFDGFRSLGVGETEALAAVERSVQIARDVAPRGALVAGSVGCYGASLHNGAEYTGVYPGMDEDKLVAWHRPRMKALISAKCDVLACETMPCLQEARALVRLLEEMRFPAWVTFACRSGTEVNSGEQFVDCVRAVASSPHVVGVGVNCTKPEYVAELVVACRSELPQEKHVVVYPNGGETWCGETHTWISGTTCSDSRFVELARQWVELGADCVGGCCRTTPSTIAALRAAFSATTTVVASTPTAEASS
eukprot:TRINITY_DN4134_c0_g4_i1.p1 TRINITY_DN4134_c0_g4~~TRINITY_DN4134_c0_g4_i1.p1  ORF type:complete len:360 (-),score=44.96 TRINITY_DN4134_c0_g4_i1:410-1450(-)